MTDDLATEVAATREKEARQIADLLASTVYPRFLGTDGSGDYVWELANGRWTFGADPHSAADKARTFRPERYVEKYGMPTGIESQEVLAAVFRGEDGR
jgi:hypothetical protein